VIEATNIGDSTITHGDLSKKIGGTTCRISLDRPALRLGEARGLKICSTILCSSVISACGKGKQWQIALDLLKSMEDSGQSVDLWGLAKKKAMNFPKGFLSPNIPSP